MAADEGASHVIDSSLQNNPESQREVEAGNKPPLPQRIRVFAHSIAASIYVSHFLSSWGDRMWQFAVGLYLVDLSPGSLRLVAGYGFSRGIAAVLLGALIGDIVDRYPRLHVARTVLAFQNVLVALCAVLVCIIYQYQTVIYSAAWTSTLCEVGIIVISIMASLFSTALKLSVEKDWISVICEGDSSKLAQLSSTMRAIDQFTNITAPIVVGFIMSIGSNLISAIFVAVWNIISVFIEYKLLVRIYNKVPQLAIRQQKAGNDDAGSTEALAESSVEPKDSISVNKVDVGVQESNGVDDNQPTSSHPPENTIEVNGAAQPTSATFEDENQNSVDHKKPSSSVEHDIDLNTADEHHHVSKDTKTILRKDDRESDKSESSSKCLNICKKMFSAFLIVKNGWRVYFSHQVKFAGIGLSFCYMTVLGFDDVTNGFAYSQGASQVSLGVMMAISAVVGLSATFAYPRLRNRIGIERSGLIGFSAEVAALSLCVLSVWMPGSPFDLSMQTPTMTSTPTTSITEMANITTQSFSNQTMEVTTPAEGGKKSIASLALLMAGIIAARFGLWTLDLSISQLLLERVDKSQRGVVNGVQSSLNMIQDMIKFVLVIGLPLPRHFGLLVILSFAAVCTGGISYSIYSYKIRGHLFHFNRLCPCLFKRGMTLEQP